jgi:hypothetical protein
VNVKSIPDALEDLRAAAAAYSAAATAAEDARSAYREAARKSLDRAEIFKSA